MFIIIFNPYFKRMKIIQDFMGISPYSNYCWIPFHLNISKALIKLVTTENDYLFSKYIISINGVTIVHLEEQIIIVLAIVHLTNKYWKSICLGGKLYGGSIMCWFFLILWGEPSIFCGWICSPLKVYHIISIVICCLVKPFKFLNVKCIQ
jgi:hypothetical protein